MSDQNTKPARIVRDFTDAGTEERFTAGETRPIEAGAFANYAAAGLVTEAKPNDEPAPAGDHA